MGEWGADGHLKTQERGRGGTSPVPRHLGLWLLASRTGRKTNLFKPLVRATSLWRPQQTNTASDRKEVTSWGSNSIFHT